MNKISRIKTGFAAAALAVAMGTTALVAFPAAAQAQAGEKQLTLSIGEAQQINLGSPVTDVVVADPRVADVDITSNRKLYILAKGPGITDVVATDGAGRTVYRAKVLVGGNLSSIDQLLKLAMPDSDIQVTTMNNVVLLTGTVAQPGEAAEAEDLARAFVANTGGGNVTATNVINRIKTATPLQINLQVRVAEVSRSLAKEISGNLQSGKSGIDRDGVPYFFGAGRGRDVVVGGTVVYPEDGNTIAGIGRLFGIDIEAAFDLSERAGLTSTLANPNLTTVSGETAEFLAGGRFPVVTSSNNGTSVSYESFGVGLTYTPIVLSDGRISLRVRTEVSDISSQGAVRVGGLEVPATTNRMAETTVELGSGQSIMIAGLLKNDLSNSVAKMPGVGDIPVLGALFKSNGWRRNETELMIVITPYLVKPVSDSEIKLPTDGIHSVHDAERVLMNKVTEDMGRSTRPMPTIAPAPANGPEMGSVSDAAPAIPSQKATATAQASISGPGFSFDN
ncbi:MAG: type II and III secretion system protein family protein [Sphingomonadaceae bacterium]|nr:type II and III secretion system protein family protein [Sphingomonadaceae bacterium]